MRWSLFLLILMGQCVFFTCQLYKYHFIRQRQTWQDAQKFCRSNYTDLATVYDMTDMRKLRKMNQGQEAWIGLYTDPNETLAWHWSLPGVEFMENQTEWRPDNPNPPHTKLCVQVNINERKWLHDGCQNTHDFICYDERNSSNKFHVIRKNMKWPKAQRYCRENHTVLVSGLDQLNDTELIEKAGKNDKETFWIGLFKDTWKWSDGSSFSFRNWDEWSRLPGEKCAVTVKSNGKWKNDTCNTNKSFFCYEDKVILIKQNKTWDEAFDYCREKYLDLVSITNLKDQRWVQERAKNASTPFVWLGLRYTCTLGFWFWVSDKTVSYENWASGVSSDNCDMSGAMERGGEYKWHKKDDTEKFNFICSV